MAKEKTKTLKETETSKEQIPSEEKHETSSELLEEMEEIVEEEEKIKDNEISKIADEKFRIEERRAHGPEAREDRFAREAREKLNSWVPKTQLGKEVRAGKITNIDEILEGNLKILESEIVDILLPNLFMNTLFIGQAKGKFGGGKRRAFRQTQKKTKESNVLTFGVMAVVGDKNGHIGIGYGRAAETLPAKEKAVRKAKLNIIKILRGCGSYDCSCDEPHSTPMKTEGKCSSVKITLIPAPQGTGLVVGDELKKILEVAGIKDVYSQSWGGVRTTVNTAKACMQALMKISEVKL